MLLLRLSHVNPAAKSEGHLLENAWCPRCRDYHNFQIEPLYLGSSRGLAAKLGRLEAGSRPLVWWRQNQRNIYCADIP